VTDAGRTVALVLAAGSASRFGSPKALASLDGRPLLQHAVDVATGLGLAGTVVVLGEAAAAIDEAVDWRDAVRVRNRHPEAGLASSVRIGLDAAREQVPDAAAIVILLGDQPFVQPAAIRALLAAELAAGRSIVAPRYVAGGGPNPLLLTREAWVLAEHLAGDRGFGPLLAAHPEIVTWVDVEGDNPDVDTPADLALAAWAAQVRANREQVDRHREVPDGPDFYGPVSPLFVVDPRRTDDPVLDRLLALARPADTWLDIGAGAGRFALPLALRVREVVAVDPSTGMLDALREAMVVHGIANIEVIHGRWPLAPAELPTAGSPSGDVALIAQVGYDIERIGPFLDAMEAAADRLCVAVLMSHQPAAMAHAFWGPIHGEERIALPALHAFIDLLRVRGRAPDVSETEQPARGFDSLEDAERFIRRQLWIAEGGRHDRRFQDLLRERARLRDGRWYLDDAPPTVGVVTWRPR
jgi:CTP:molybdopterin cytidylyltransferase MocA/SAM-dependent methyltransferase